MLRRIGASDDFFYTPTAEGMTRALIELGYTPADAARTASTQGIHIARPGGRQVVVVRNIDAAPHESFHAMQDVLGETANRAIDEVVQNSFTPAEWEAYGKDQAARLRGVSADDLPIRSPDWRDAILEVSGWGEQNALEQIAKDTADTMRLPVESPEVQQAAGELATEMIQNKAWRQVLKPSARREIADRYIARELAADQWDTVLNNIGPSLQSNSFPATMARMAAGIVSALGREPLAERVGYEGLPLRYEAVKAVTKAAKGLEPAAPVVTPRVGAPPAFPRGAEPLTPEQVAQSAQEARDIAASAPDQLLPGQTQSQREILGAVAEGIAGRSAVMADYRSAQGLPAGDPSAEFLTRRAEIEAARNIPEAERASLRKIFFPYRVEQRGGGKIQVLGYSPEVVASNAIRWTKALSALAVKDPTNKELAKVPYELDLQAGEFTARGWTDFIRDAQTYAANQIAGRTGAGTRVKVPEGLRSSGFFPPPETGTATPLGVEQMNFLNIVHGQKPPITPRVQAKKIPGAVASEEVSKLTMPGRVVTPALVEPIRPSTPGGIRKPFSGPAAEAVGIVPPGGERAIMEVNPLRAALEKTMQAQKVPIPQTLEAMQRLNVEHFVSAAPEPLQPRTVGANILTQRAGFKPPERTAEEVERMNPEDFSLWAKTLEGGITGEAVRLGASLGPEAAEQLTRLHKESADQSKRYMMDGDFDNALAVVTKGQFFREAMEAATNTGSMAAAKEHGLLEFKPQKRDKKELAEARKAWKEQGTESPFFKRWFGGSQVVDPEGSPAVVFHGTTRKFNTFERGQANVENDIGKGFYFSNTPKEVAANYKDIGPDLTNRVEDRAEKLIANYAAAGEELTSDTAREIALNELVGPTKRVIKAYLKLKNPVRIGGEKETFFDIEKTVDANGDLMEEPTGKLPGFIDALRNNRFEHVVEYVAEILLEDVGDTGGFSASELVRRVKEAGPEWEDPDTGKSVVGEVIRQAFEDLGFDGIIDSTVANRFRTMKGIGPDTVHYIAFQPNQIKSASNRGTFELATPDIRFKPQKRDDIKGGSVSAPAPKYPEAATSDGNPWVRGSDAPGDNAGRTLLVQFSSDLINRNAQKDQSAAYYDKLYSGTRKGYARLQDFWEIPQWTGFASKFLPNADFYVVRDMAEAKRFLGEAGYDRVAFSSLDVNKDMIRELAQSYEGTFDVGGYAEKGYFEDIPNIKWHASMEDWAKDMGVPYENGVDYRHFQGGEVIPRLTMSQGCKHKCAFCTVEKTVSETPAEVVTQQADQIANLGSKLVYLNDKTFGQAKNFDSLPDVYQRIKEKNPGFEGFIIQTTASQMTKFTPEFLAKSGIRFVELGIETYNDPILKEMHKPATEAVMDKAVDRLRQAGIALIPNIIIGFPGETEATYAHTLDFLKRNEDVISHANIYNLALYKDAELGKKISTASEDDFNENVMEKSFHTNPEVHRVFAGKMYGFAESLLESKQFKAGEKKLDEDVKPLETATSLWVPRTGGGVQAEQQVKREGKPSRFEPITDEERLGIPEGAPPAKGGFARQQVIRREAEARRAAPEPELEAEQFKPGKAKVEPKGKKQELKLKKAGADGFSKVWILPNGDVQQLGGTWHHQWLHENPDVSKRFNVSLPAFSREDAEGARQEALKRGFVRINYGVNQGRMTIEGRVKDWRYQKNAVFDVLEKNIKDIDNLTISLYDDAVKKVVDSASEQLFMADSPKEALANIPFITGREIGASGERGVQYKPAKESSKRVLFSASLFFPSEVSRIRKAAAGEGQTFDVSGEPWEAPRDQKTDLVTLASVNVPRGELTQERIQQAMEAHKAALEARDLLAGVFNFDDKETGAPMTSIDANVPVSQEHRANSVEFAKDNDQISIWDASKFEEVKTGGSGNTRLKTPKQIAVAATLLRAGKPADVQRILNRNPEIPAGYEPEIPYNRHEIAEMNQPQLRARFPEAVVPKSIKEILPSEIAKAPLLKGAKTEEEKVRRFADKLLAEVDRYKDTPQFKEGSKWYSEIVPELRQTFGDWTDKFTQLLAATSPNEGPEMNFRYAYEALDGWKKGAFEKVIRKYREGLDKIKNDTWMDWLQAEHSAGRIETLPAKPSAATFLAEWVEANNLKPIRGNGKLFGMHGLSILKVLAEIWLEENKGPKTLQFMENLLGTSHGATIDVWADRTMRRLGYEGFAPRWRIMPDNKSGVNDTDFEFSQKVFAQVAERSGMLPDALQGALWFSEKLLWYSKGWSDIDLGSFKGEIGKIPKIEREMKKTVVEPKD
jgi:hypothetical protein